MTQAGKAFVAVATFAVTAVTLIIVVSVFLLISTSRQQETLDQLRAGQDAAERQRVLLVDQGRLLVECTTPSPTPGGPAPPGDDGRHECYESGQARTGDAVGAIVAAIAASQVALAECERAGAPDLAACIASKTPPRP